MWPVSALLPVATIFCLNLSKGACFPPASHIPISSLFLKTLSPSFFTKGRSLPQSRARRRGAGGFPGRGLRTAALPRPGKLAAGARWERGEPRSLCLRISLGTFYSGVNY